MIYIWAFFRDNVLKYRVLLFRDKVILVNNTLSNVIYRCIRITCGVKANMRSFKEYNLLVLRMPTSRDFLPDKPNFLFLPVIRIRFGFIINISINDDDEVFVNTPTNYFSLWLNNVYNIIVPALDCMYLLFLLACT